MTPDESYLSGLQRNLTRLQAKLPRLCDGSNERTNCEVHISGLQQEITKVQARIAAAASAAAASASATVASQ